MIVYNAEFKIIEPEKEVCDYYIQCCQNKELTSVTLNDRTTECYVTGIEFGTELGTVYMAVTLNGLGI